MNKQFIIIVLLFSCNKLYSQNTDIKLLRSVYTQEAVRSDGFFRLISDAEVYLVIGTPTAVAAAGDADPAGHCGHRPDPGHGDRRQRADQRARA